MDGSVNKDIIIDVSEQNKDIFRSNSWKLRKTSTDLKKMCFICGDKRITDNSQERMGWCEVDFGKERLTKWSNTYEGGNNSRFYEVWCTFIVLLYGKSFDI